MLTTSCHGDLPANVKSHGLLHDLDKSFPGGTCNSALLGMGFFNNPFPLGGYHRPFNDPGYRIDEFTAVIHGRCFYVSVCKFLLQFLFLFPAACKRHPDGSLDNVLAAK